jgi:hypothetical protein
MSYFRSSERVRQALLASSLAARLVSPPDWLGGFIAHLAGAYPPGRACTLITALGRLLEDDGQPGHPQALLEMARLPGRLREPPGFRLNDEGVGTYYSVAWEVARHARHLGPSPGAYAPGGASGGTPVALAAQVTQIAWLDGRTPVGIVITKDLCTYTTIILRQDKSLRDHGRAAVCRVVGVHRDKGDTCPLACAPGPAVASVESALRHRADHKGGATCETTVVSETGLEPTRPPDLPKPAEVPPRTRLRDK